MAREVPAKVLPFTVESPQPSSQRIRAASQLSLGQADLQQHWGSMRANGTMGAPLASVAGVGRLQGLVFKAAGDAVNSMPAATATPQFVPGRILVAQQAGITDASFQQTLTAVGARSLGRIIDVHLVEVPQGSEQSIVAGLTGNANVRFAELDQLVAPAATSNDPLLGSQWHLSKINASAAWDLSTGAGVTIAILDTGVDGTHPDLAAKIVPGWNIYDSNNNTTDVLGHGTAVAGVAASTTNNGVGVAGVATGARIMPIRITDTVGRARWSHAAQGLIWAADQGARVSNVSFQGMASSKTMQTAVAYFRSKGGVVIAAAGNTGAVDSSASSDAMIVVSATDNQDQLTSWSTYGSFVDISAPGADIYSTAMGGGYSTWSGTSMSAAIVAGTAALVLARRPELSPAQVESALLASATDLGGAGYDTKFGYGRVNAALAVQAGAAVPAGLVAGYAFSEASGTVTADASGNGITGTLSGASWTPSGRIGNALVFNGASAVVNLGNPAPLQLTGSMSVGAWINTSAFPADDAAIVSKRSSSNLGFQLDTTVDMGVRTVGFKLTSATGTLMARFGATTLQANQWYHVMGVFDAATQTINVYLNGQLDNGALVGTVTSTQQNSTSNVNIGQRPGMSGYAFNGTIDEVHIYNRALPQAEVQFDMATAVVVTSQVTAPAPTPTCTRKNPTLNITPPISAGVPSGTPVPFSVTVTNNDTTGCDASVFALASSVPAGWATNTLAAVALSAGASVVTTLQVTSPAGIANSSNLVTIAASNQSASTFAGSGAATYVVANTVPGAPVIGTATAGNAQATVSFTPPTSNGGSAITSYTVTSSPGGLTATGATSPLTVTGLSNGTPYTFSVKANNSVGSSAASAASNAVTPVAPSSQLLTSACSATSGPLTLNASASRAGGVAPLAVVFNASGTTHTGLTAYATQPFHEVHYTWTFGDPGDSKGNTGWTYGTRTGAGSKNIAYGPVAAHVFDPIAGTGARAYVVNVSAFDGTNTATCSIQVAVDDPDTVFSGTKTTCVSATSLPVAGAGGCPVGAAVAQQSSWPTIVGSYLGTGKRVLLRGNGDVYTGGANASLAVTGPAMIGMYGGGGKPIIQTTSTSGSIAKLTGTISDLRLVDLDFDGQSVTSTSAMTSSAVRATKVLWYRVDIHNIGCGLDLEETQASAAPDSLAFVDSTIQRLNSTGGTNCPIGLRLTGSQVAVLGNLFNDSTAGSAEHLARLHWLDRAVVSNNSIQQGHNGKEMLSIRALDSSVGKWGLTGDAIATKYVVVSENQINTNTYAGIQTVFSGDGSDRDIWRDILIERNYIPVATGGGVAVRVLGSRITIRNNLMDLTSSAEQIAIIVDRAYVGIAAPSDVAIHNNTIYSGASVGGFAGIILLSGSTGLSIKNNLISAPNSIGPLVIQNQGSVSPTIANNTVDGTGAGSIKSSPAFSVMPPTAPAHFKPTCTGSNYPCAKGASVPVWIDFLGNAPAALRDLGAVTH